MFFTVWNLGLFAKFSKESEKKTMRRNRDECEGWKLFHWINIIQCERTEMCLTDKFVRIISEHRVSSISKFLLISRWFQQILLVAHWLRRNTSMKLYVSKLLTSNCPECFYCVQLDSWCISRKEFFYCMFLFSSLELYWNEKLNLIFSCFTFSSLSKLIHCKNRKSNESTGDYKLEHTQLQFLRSKPIDVPVKHWLRHPSWPKWMID